MRSNNEDVQQYILSGSHYQYCTGTVRGRVEHYGCVSVPTGIFLIFVCIIFTELGFILFDNILINNNILVLLLLYVSRM